MTTLEQRQPADIELLITAAARHDALVAELEKGRQSASQLLVLAAAARWPVTYAFWQGKIERIDIELPDGLQAVKSTTIRALLGKGLIEFPPAGAEDSGLQLTDAGRAASSDATAELVAVPGWRLTPTPERLWAAPFGAGTVELATVGFMNTAVERALVEHIAYALSAQSEREPAKAKRMALYLRQGTMPDAVAAIIEQAHESTTVMFAPLLAGGRSGLRIRMGSEEMRWLTNRC